MRANKPDLRLISCTEKPLETLFAAWAQSRPTQYPELFKWLKTTVKDAGPDDNDSESVLTASDIEIAIRDEIITQAQVEDVFKNVTAMSIPVSESIHFTWGFTNLPIEWREQAVRKRQWGFWLTSMREFTMEGFASDGRFAPPVSEKSPESLEVFFHALKTVENAYTQLTKMGWTQEEARKVIPLSATHNGTMFSTYRALLDTISARSCWIAQVDLWAPVLEQMVRDLKKKHPLLGLIVSPPCFNRYSNDFKSCKYDLINKNRLSGKDPYAVCPLYATHNGLATGESSYKKVVREHNEPSYAKDVERLLPIWSAIWQRDPFTGALK